MSTKKTTQEKLIVDNSPPELTYLTGAMTYGEAVMLEKCTRCQSTGVPQSKGNKNICIQCEKALNDTYAIERRQNEDWQELAAQQGLELWERQPSETQTEWMIWQHYCSYYPGRVPPYSHIAEELGVSTSMVSQSAQRWNYKVRLLSWSRYSDALTVQSRVENVHAMNDKHIKMSQDINSKIEKAIALLDPNTLRPGELVNLLKLSSELERKAQTHVYEKVPNSVTETKSSDQRQTKSEDIGEIMSILSASGALPPYGVKQTVTETQIVVKGDADYD